MDICDEADRVTEWILLEALTMRRQPPSPKSTGYCLHCGAVVERGARWCNPDCRDDWEREERARGLS